jgi:hypothetical protein
MWATIRPSSINNVGRPLLVLLVLSLVINTDSNTSGREVDCNEIIRLIDNNYTWKETHNF